ncbi:MAG: hypothetical protein ACRCSR_03495 [Bacteroidales bacterium]
MPASIPYGVVANFSSSFSRKVIYTSYTPDSSKQTTTFGVLVSEGVSFPRVESFTHSGSGFNAAVTDKLSFQDKKAVHEYMLKNSCYFV